MPGAQKLKDGTVEPDKPSIEPQMIMTRTLAEIIRLQRWAGGESVPADRLFGLLHGFESVVEAEAERCKGISKATQENVEDVLKDVEAGRQNSESLSIEARFHALRISETDAHSVMQLCLLQSRFTDGIRMIAEAHGSRFKTLRHSTFDSDERSWRGALHYLELYDTTDGVRKKLHTAYAAAVPRVGEMVTPEIGSSMRVVAVDHVVSKYDEHTAAPILVLTPYVILEQIAEGNDTGVD